MALSIRRKELTREEQLAIRKLLLLTPKSKPHHQHTIGEEPKPPIQFWYAHDDIVELPYYMGGVFLQQRGVKIPPPFNTWEPHQTISASFTGQLLEPQVAVVEEAESQLKKYGTTTLNLPPGSGKTVCGAYLALRRKL